MLRRLSRLAARTLALTASLGAVWPTCALADNVPKALANRFREISQKAERALAGGDEGAAIRAYEDGLLTLGDDYGRAHLRLGQLYRKLRIFSEAAQHFRACDADTRVDPIDREVICREGFTAVTAPLELTNTPEGVRVVVLEPVAFIGPIANETRLPLGPARLVVEAPTGERVELNVDVTAPSTRVRVPNPAKVVEVEADAPASEVAPPDRAWIGWATAGTGLALVATGLTLGFINRGELDDVRARQVAGRCGPTRCAGDLKDLEQGAQVADGLWLGGAAVTGLGVGLWFWLD